MNTFLFYFLLFIIYSFIGWIIDITTALIEEPKLHNRGFLIGPYCPIYGYVAILMILFLDRFKDNAFIIFILSMLLCSVFEYIVSFVLEKIFNTKWWDYSKHKFNIKGRVCLSNAIIFSIVGVLLIYFINPFVVSILNIIPDYILYIISIILLIIFIIDSLVSIIVIYKITRNTKNIDYDYTVEIKKKVSNTIKKKN